MSFTATEVRALRALTNLWQRRPFAIIGARALSLAGIPMSWRKTEDLDLVVVAEQDDYPFGMDQLGDWHHDPRYEHRWVSPDALRCDVLPAGQRLVKVGTLTWPSGHQMTVTGLDLALKHCTPVVGEELTVSVARISVVVLLKMIAFLDRPVERERDLEDIAHTMHEYSSDDERRWDIEEIRERDWDEQSAWLLGTDIAGIAADEHRRLGLQFLEEMRKEPRLGRIAELGPVRWARDARHAAARMAALSDGFEHGIRQRPNDPAEGR